MPRKKETLTLSVPPGTKEKLDAIAARLGIKWGERPSPSGLVRAIADSSLYVGNKLQFNPKQVQTLQQAVKALIDSGQSEYAQSVITLLLNHGQIATPLRHELLKIASQPIDGWRIQVDQYLTQKQPFRLIYTNAQAELLEFTVRHAEVVFYEKRHFLQIWCDETEESTDLPELRHNRCLRFDRIQGILEATGEWRGSFDAIQVQLKFTGSMVKAYEAKSEDISNERVGDNRIVIRNIINPFWLIREVQRYGANCEIISPQEIRDRFHQELLKTLKHYE